MNISPCRRSCVYRVGYRLHSPQVLTAIRTASNGLSKRVILRTVRVLSIGLREIFVMAQDEMRRFSLTRRGAAPWKTIARSYLKLQNWRAPFVERQNLR